MFPSATEYFKENDYEYWLIAHTTEFDYVIDNYRGWLGGDVHLSAKLVNGKIYREIFEVDYSKKEHYYKEINRHIELFIHILYNEYCDYLKNKIIGSAMNVQQTNPSKQNEEVNENVLCISYAAKYGLPYNNTNPFGIRYK